MDGREARPRGEGWRDGAGVKQGAVGMMVARGPAHGSEIDRG